MDNTKDVLTRLVDAPQAVALLLAPLGMTPQALENSFGKLYSTSGCSTVCAASPPLRFMRNASLRPTAEQAIKAVASALRSAEEEVPLVMHLFSNGGAFILEPLELLLQEQRDADSELVRSRLKLGYQFFDSCPCYIRTLWHLGGLSRSFPFRNWTTVGRSAYTFGAATALSLWTGCTLSVSKPQRFWRRMEDSEACLHQVYMYTTADMASDAFMVDELVGKRRRKGAQVTVYRYEDSAHCALLRDHPEEYRRAVDAALAAAVERARK